MRILGQLSCYVCGDTWFRDMDDMEIAAYMAEHPEVDLSSLTDIDLGETLCDGCEDFYNDEYELAEAEEIEAQHLEELKEDACAAAGTGEFAIWHFDPADF